jgi:hypothetical protein
MKPSLRLLPGLLALLFLGSSLAHAQPRHSDDIVTPTPVALSPTDAAQELTDFRHSRLDGDFCLVFELRHRPRKGDDTLYTGVAWGTWNDQGPLTRFRVIERPASGGSGQSTPAVWEWLVKNGTTPHVWVFSPGALAAREVPASEWRTPLFPGTVYTPFDLLMPFLYWSDFTYVGPARILGRGVDTFSLKPPAVEPTPGIASVRVSLDRELKALVRTEQLDAKGALVRQFDLGSFAKVQGQWMIQSLELLDAASHDYDRFEVKSAALKQKLDPVIFDPAHLGEKPALPPQSAWANL